MRYYVKNYVLYSTEQNEVGYDTRITPYPDPHTDNRDLRKLTANLRLIARRMNRAESQALKLFKV